MKFKYLIISLFRRSRIIISKPSIVSILTTEIEIFENKNA
jgi:hypothetical protein